jgi:hypothetical protein
LDYYTLFVFKTSLDSSVSIALGYGLEDRGSRVRFPAEAGNFSLNHCVQNGSRTHPASYSMGTVGSFPGVKRPQREADHSPPSSAEVKDAWSYTSTPQYVFMAWCSVKAQIQLYLLPLPLYLKRILLLFGSRFCALWHVPIQN